jgi:hypothetical protein
MLLPSFGSSLHCAFDINCTVLICTSLALWQVGSGSLSHLLTWHGSQQQLRPVLFISHVDVVPVTAETLQVRGMRC